MIDHGFIPLLAAPFIASEYQVKFATSAWEHAGAANLRQRVFCEEQGIFHGHDRDDIDAVAIPIVAVAMLGVCADTVVGTVRIHEDTSEGRTGIWWGSRLAGDQDFRRIGTLGAALIRLAVSSANARGCKRFFAYVQSQNVLLFRRLHWKSLDVVDIHGREHHRMEADLAYYPPFHAPEIGFCTLRKAA